MTTIRDVVINAVSIITWEKEQGKSTNETRKEYYSMLFDAMREHTGISDGDLVNASNLFGVGLAEKGLKKDGIKVKRSEFRRIWENIKHVCENTASWQGAIRDIRTATTLPSVLMLDDMVTIADQIEALQAKLADKYSEWQALDSTAIADTITFSDETDLDMTATMRKAA